VRRRLYTVAPGDDGALRVTDKGAHPRQWQLIEVLNPHQLQIALVTGYDADGRPVVVEMAGRIEGYPRGRQVWFRGITAERRATGLPGVGSWWADFERGAARPGPRAVTTAMIDGVQCRIIAVDINLTYIVTAPINDDDRKELADRRDHDAAIITVLNAEVASRYTEPRNFPIPENTERLPLFGDAVAWDLMIGAEDTPDSVLRGEKQTVRPYEPLRVYRTNSPLVAYIWAAGRGGHLIGFTYRNSETIAGSVHWSGKRDRALRRIAAEYEQAYWLKHVAWMGGA
jgi:hypothetical protein